MSTGMHNYGSGRRTWAKWRERNRTGRDAYYDRMEVADQCLATCPVCWTQCDMPEGHLYAHQFEGKCEPASFDEVFVDIEPDASRFAESLRKMDEPVLFWEPARYAYEDFKVSIERAVRKLNEGGGVIR